VKKYDDEDEALVQPPSFDEPAPTGSTSVQERGSAKGLAKTEPVTALEHYEKAVEREAAGNLGDSLRLYRKAFRVRCRLFLVTINGSQR
jgi:F-box protein 9